MGNYSIKELERLSGIRAHTIRIWEKRHGLVTPQRTKTNIRFYSDDDLKKIINVSVLNNHGVKISKIANLTQTEINQRVSELSESKNSVDIYIEQLVVAMIDMEEERFEEILGKLSLKIGFERMMLEVIYPFLEKIGVLWLTDNVTPAQEHFISNLIRNKLIVATDSLHLPGKDAHRVALFLPENELHEIGLLFYCYICKKNGLRTYYLGQTVPYVSLKSICEEHNPNLIVSSFTSLPQSHAIQNYVNRLAADFPKTKVLLTGYALKKTAIKPPLNVHLFDNALSFKELVIK
jgi:MerR family transcriptional regulator, light-induced transcriptional regulator